MGLKRGSLIKVRAFGGKELVRRFLSERNGTILICSEEEYQSARLEKREPICVGFPVTDIVEAKTRNSLNQGSELQRGQSLKRASKKTGKSSHLIGKRRPKVKMQRGI